MFHYTTIVAVLALVFYMFLTLRVSAIRGQTKVHAPATTGDPTFERAFRIQMNTLEWLPIFLPGLWFFAAYVSDWIAAVIGLVWIAGRIVYLQGYTQDPARRGLGFSIQAAAAAVLLAGGLIGVLVAMIRG